MRNARRGAEYPVDSGKKIYVARSVINDSIRGGGVLLLMVRPSGEVESPETYQAWGLDLNKLRNR